MANKSIGFRHAELNDLSDLENRCFPPAKAYKEKQLKQRQFMALLLDQNGAVNTIAARSLMPFWNIHLENAEVKNLCTVV